MAKVKIKLDCYYCNKTFRKWHPRKRTVVFCKKCFKTYLTRKSGTQLEGQDWVREIARIRDKHTCQKCFKVWCKGSRRFDVHHLNGNCGKKSRSYDKLKDIDSLTTLCHKCHLNLDEVVKKMSEKSSPRSQRDKDYYYKNWEKIYKNQKRWLFKQK